MWREAKLREIAKQLAVNNMQHLKMVMFGHSPGTESSARALNEQIREEQERLSQMMQLSDDIYSQIQDLQPQEDFLDGIMKYVD